MEFTEEEYFQIDCTNCLAALDGRCFGEWGWCVDWTCWDRSLEEDDDYV